MKKINENNNDKCNKALGKWMTLLVLSPLGIIVSYIGGKCVDGIYSSYIEILITNYIFWVGGLIWWIGFLIIQGKFLFKKRKYKSSAIFLIILILLCAGSCKSLANGFLYQDLIVYAKDLSYVKEKSYCEKIEKLNDIYKQNTSAKGNQVDIFIKTENSTYQALSNIVKKDNYDEFKKSFRKCKNVKIKYLPNSNFLISIEPLEDEK